MSKTSTPPSSAVKKEGGGAGGDGSKVPRDPSKLCKCKKSKCVRQYCVCFRAGLLCEGCECSECLNDGKHEVERLAAIEHIKTSDPLAFVDKIRPENQQDSQIEEGKDGRKHHVRGCRCKNSRCLKKYCECFEHGVPCSAKCECRDCQNNKPKPDDGEGAGGALASAAKKQRRAPPANEELAQAAALRDSAAASKLAMGAGALLGAAAKALQGQQGDKSSFLLSAPQTPQRAADYHLIVPLTPVEPPNPHLNLDFQPLSKGTTPSTNALCSTQKLLQTPKAERPKVPQLTAETSPGSLGGFSLKQMGFDTPSKDLGLPASLSASSSLSAANWCYCNARRADKVLTRRDPRMCCELTGRHAPSLSSPLLLRNSADAGPRTQTSKQTPRLKKLTS